MSKRLVLLDFDGTLTRKDTLFEFIRFYHGWIRYLGGLILLSPWFVFFKLKLIANNKVKEIVLTYFFGDEREEMFNARCSAFASQVIPGLIKPSALRLLSKEVAEKSHVIVVSASPENWVKPWCDSVHIQCLATRLEVIDQKISGKINGRNCYGDEKVVRIKSAYPPEQYDRIIAYGDSRGDREMLQLAHEPHFRVL